MFHNATLLHKCKKKSKAKFTFGVWKQNLWTQTETKKKNFFFFFWLTCVMIASWLITGRQRSKLIARCVIRRPSFVGLIAKLAASDLWSLAKVVHRFETVQPCIDLPSRSRNKAGWSDLFMFYQFLCIHISLCHYDLLTQSQLLKIPQTFTRLRNID